MCQLWFTFIKIWMLKNRMKMTRIRSLFWRLCAVLPRSCSAGMCMKRQCLWFLFHSAICRNNCEKRTQTHLAGCQGMHTCHRQVNLLDCHQMSIVGGFGAGGYQFPHRQHHIHHCQSFAGEFARDLPFGMFKNKRCRSPLSNRHACQLLVQRAPLPQPKS